MSSWIEQAADHAVELAGELVPPDVGERAVIVQAAAHLTYMAGLIRGLLQVTMDEHLARRFSSGEQLEKLDDYLDRAANRVRWEAVERLKKVALERADRILQLRKQRDELLAAAEVLLNADVSQQTVAARGLRDVIARIHGG